ncbi:hypothetical protein Tco_0905892 [Tanacetum coccineum]
MHMQTYICVFSFMLTTFNLLLDSSTPDGDVAGADLDDFGVVNGAFDPLPADFGDGAALGEALGAVSRAIYGAALGEAV